MVPSFHTRHVLVEVNFALMNCEGERRLHVVGCRLQCAVHALSRVVFERAADMQVNGISSAERVETKNEIDGIEQPAVAVD